MAGLPINIPIPAENYIASYNYSDISEGTGITSYYGATYGDATAGTANILTTRQLAGMVGSSSGSTNVQADITVMDKDFDVIFNTPKRISGLMLVHLSHSVGDANCASQTNYAVVKVRKFSGGVESEIVSVTTATNSGSANTQYYYNKVLGINVPLTTFKIGDSLRITVELHVTLVSSTVAADWSFNADPLNTSNVNYSFTYFRTDTPFRLDN